MNKEAIVGIKMDGDVKFCYSIDYPMDEREACSLAGQWLKEGLTVKRCSQDHARQVVGKRWEDPV